MAGERRGHSKGNRRDNGCESWNKADTLCCDEAATSLETRYHVSLYGMSTQHHCLVQWGWRSSTGSLEWLASIEWLTGLYRTCSLLQPRLTHTHTQPVIAST